MDCEIEFVFVAGFTSLKDDVMVPVPGLTPKAGTDNEEEDPKPGTPDELPAETGGTAGDGAAGWRGSVVDPNFGKGEEEEDSNTDLVEVVAGAVPNVEAVDGTDG